MQRYGGRLLVEVQDSFGPIEVIETKGVRSLHFGNGIRQSCLQVSEPERLFLEYTQGMATGLVFCPTPSRILILGHGGGTLTKFLHQQFSPATLDVVDLRPTLFELGQNYFFVPKSPRIRYFHGDAAAYIKAPGKTAYDLILVDLYDDLGMAQVLEKYGFYQRIKAMLSPQGLAVFNLWTSYDQLGQHLLSLLRQAFGQGLLQLPMVETANLIAFCGDLQTLRLPPRELKARAQRLEQASRVPLCRQAKLLLKDNQQLFSLA